jgi:hypothetical protein
MVSMNGGYMKNTNDKKDKQSTRDSLNDTGKFVKFSLGKGYIPPNNQPNETGTPESKKVQPKLQYMPDGPNGTEGMPFYEIDNPIKLTKHR